MLDVGRRQFITLLGGAASAWPLAAHAQQPKVWHVGFLAPVPPTPAMLSALRDGLRERGYVEGQNLSIDVRWSEGSFEQNPGLAADLVRSNVDVIVAWSSPAVFSCPTGDIDHSHRYGECRRPGGNGFCYKSGA